MPVARNRNVALNSSTYTLVANSGEPGIALCPVATTMASTASPSAGEVSSLAAATRHPHTGAGKLYMKTVTGTSTAEFTGS